MKQTEADAGIMLNGLDGSNPLGFLAFVGVAAVAQREFPELRLGWELTGLGWRPAIQDCGSGGKQELAEMLLHELKHAPTSVFDVDNRMPFDVAKFFRALRDAQAGSSTTERRDADLLAGMGTELYPDKNTNQFQDSKLRMVRSGDSKGQGLPFYAKSTQKDITLEHIQRTLFNVWDYRDGGYSLRWDPSGDQRYALGWRDPSKAKSGTMLAANCLAVEALRLFPTLMVGKQARTTGFQRIGRREIHFVWPIWTPMLGVDTLRSLLASPDLIRDPVPHASLIKRGVVAVYRSERIRQNQYYSNFSPALPV